MTINTDEEALAVLLDERDGWEWGSKKWQKVNAAFEHIRQRLAAVDGWLAIESAPAETMVLLLVRWSDEPVVAEKRNGRWRVGTEHHEVSCGTYCYGGTVGTDGTLDPTHWRPMPPAPSRQEG